MNYAQLLKQLEAHEGKKLKPYHDTVGKLTIGIGRNLDDRGITSQEADLLCLNDIEDVTSILSKQYPWFIGLTEIRQRVLIDMAFNMGPSGLATFKQTLKAVSIGDYNDAADRMLQSFWAKQVGQRAQTLSTMMRTNQDAF